MSSRDNNSLETCTYVSQADCHDFIKTKLLSINDVAYLISSQFSFPSILTLDSLYSNKFPYTTFLFAYYFVFQLGWSVMRKLLPTNILS